MRLWPKAPPVVIGTENRCEPGSHRNKGIAGGDIELLHPRAFGGCDGFLCQKRPQVAVLGVNPTTSRILPPRDLTPIPSGRIPVPRGIVELRQLRKKDDLEEVAVKPRGTDAEQLVTVR